MDTLSNKREVARELVEELIGSVIMAHNNENRDINDIVQQEFDELLEIDRNTEHIDTKFITLDEQIEDNKIKDNFIVENESVKTKFVSSDSLESTELHNSTIKEKHVRFLGTRDKKINKEIVYINTPTSSYVKFTWFVTGFLSGLTCAALISRFRRC